MTAFPFATVGFDLDGTLLDTADDLAAAANHALAVLGRPSLPVMRLRTMIGGGARHLLAQATTATGGCDKGEIDGALEDMLRYYDDHIAVHTRPFPHLAEALDALAARGVTLAVATNKREDFTHALLRDLRLADRFAFVIGGDTLGPNRAKPRPDMLQAMVRQCGGPAAFVGDSIYDVEAAHAAGMPVIACAFGYSHQPVAELGADGVIDDFADLVPALTALSRTAR